MFTFFFLFLDYAVAESFELMNSLAKLCVTFWTEGVVSCGVRCTVFCLPCGCVTCGTWAGPFQLNFVVKSARTEVALHFLILYLWRYLSTSCAQGFSFAHIFRTDLIYFVLCKRTGCELIVHFVVWQLPNLTQWARQFTMSVEAWVRFCGPLWCNISMRC